MRSNYNTYVKVFANQNHHTRAAGRVVTITNACVAWLETYHYQVFFFSERKAPTFSAMVKEQSSFFMGLTLRALLCVMLYGELHSSL